MKNPNGARWRIWLAALVAMLGLVGGVASVALTAAPAMASANGAVMRVRGGQNINWAVDGDSYVAGNGANGARYLVSPDDPFVPPSPYSGSGCSRTHNNASEQAWNMLGSSGFFINRACSGKTTADAKPEIADLANSSYATKIDVISYSAGGNDVNFGQIAALCILLTRAGGVASYHTLPDGRLISGPCYNLLESLKSHVDTVLNGEQANLVYLLGVFPSAHIVWDGYPMLTGTRTSTGKDDFPANTVNYTHSVLAQVLPDITARQQKLADQLSASNGGRVGFNNVFALFGGVNGHGVNTPQPWLYGLRPDTQITDSLHPNPTGQNKIALGMFNLIHQKGWFSNFPQRTGLGAPTFNYVPGDSENGVQPMVDAATGAVYNTTDLVPQLRICREQTLTFSGWWGHPRRVLDLTNPGPDTIHVRCEFPRANDIVFRGSASYLVGGASSNNYAFTLRSIPTGWMYNCLAGNTGVRKYTISQALLTFKGSSGTVPGRASCVPSGWRNHVLVGPNGAAYFVDGGGVRHWVQSTQTFYYLTHTYGAEIRLGAQVDINTIPEGSWQPEQLYAPTHYNTIIRRSDGVSWIVDANGWRHHIPTYVSDVCSRWIWGFHVSETGLSYALANSLPESNEWSCSPNGYIFAANEGAAYYMDGNTRRWIQDPESFWAYAQGRAVIRGISQAELNPIGEGGWMPKRLYAPSHVNTIIRRSDGVSWIVDANGWEHHIPTYASDVCSRWVWGYHVSATGLNYDQGASLPEGVAWTCDNYVVATNEGAAYLVIGGQRRWIQDAHSFWAYAAGRAVVRGISMAEVRPIPEGPWMPRA